MSKHAARVRRGLRTKAIINKRSDRPRLVVYRSNGHIYSQIVVRGVQGDEVIVSASTIDKELKASLSGSKVEQASQVGKLLANRAKAKEVSTVSFDRAGYKYHGRVKALAEGAREAGLIF